jgi:hypothetical protein
MFGLLALVLCVTTTTAFAARVGKRDSVPTLDQLDNAAWRTNNRVRDVVVLGAGGSGMPAAVFLKDKDYDVLVLERSAELGGHCDTAYFTPPQPTQPGYIDLGVQIYTDSAYNNASGFGSWRLDSRAFAQRFLPPNSLLPNRFPVDTASNVFAADFALGLFLGEVTAPPPSPDFFAAYGRLIGILTQYAWLETADFPDPIPPALLVPFDQFVALNNLSALSALIDGKLYVGGLGNYSKLTTLYALQNLRRGIIALTTDPASGFSVKNGCDTLYAGIAQYLNGGGARNVVVNATVISVDRPVGRSNRPIRLLVRFNNTRYALIKTRNLIVAFPQLLQNLQFIDLTPVERDLFAQVRVRDYYQVEVNIGGTSTQQPDAHPAWTLANINALAPGSLPTFPSMVGALRAFNYGPAAAYAFDDSGLTTAQMTTLIQQTAQRLTVLPNLTMSVVEVEVHQFQPHFTVESLAQSPTPYTRFDALQGQRHTYYTGALRSFAESTNIWEKTYRLIQEHF